MSAGDGSETSLAAPTGRPIGCLRKPFSPTCVRYFFGTTRPPAVAVVPFDLPGGTEDARWLAAGVPGMLVTGLAQTPGLDVVSAQRVEEIVRDLGVPEGGRLEGSRILEVGRRATDDELRLDRGAPQQLDEPEGIEVSIQLRGVGRGEDTLRERNRERPGRSSSTRHTAACCSGPETVGRRRHRRTSTVQANSTSSANQTTGWRSR